MPRPLFLIPLALAIMSASRLQAAEGNRMNVLFIASDDVRPERSDPVATHGTVIPNSTPSSDMEKLTALAPPCSCILAISTVFAGRRLFPSTAFRTLPCGIRCATFVPAPFSSMPSHHEAECWILRYLRIQDDQLDQRKQPG